MNKQDYKEIKDEDLFAPCGMFCGLCSSYMAMKNQVPRRRGIVSYCKGCVPRGKQCSFLVKKCKLLLNNDVRFCNECSDYPCIHLDKINQSYTTKFSYEYSFFKSLKILKEEGPSKVISELIKANHCEKCGEILCIHNGLCYKCDQKTLATMKNYRNDK